MFHELLSVGSCLLIPRFRFVLLCLIDQLLIFRSDSLLLVADHLRQLLASFFFGFSFGRVGQLLLLLRKLVGFFRELFRGVGSLKELFAFGFRIILDKVL